MNNCFILSFYLPSKESATILGEMLSTIDNNFKNVTIYVGFNPSDFISDGIEVMNKYSNLNIVYDVVKPTLFTDSDASGFQLALKLLKESNKMFDIYWFMHSKAITTNRHIEREFMINDFITHKNKIYKLFKGDNNIGSYGDMMLQLGTLEKSHRFTVPTLSGNYLDKFYDFPIKTPLEFFYAKTFYVIKGEIINHFIYNCNDSFFNEPLNIYGEKTTDRYFFERDFIRVVDKLGYVPLGRCVTGTISDNRWGNISVEDAYKKYLKEINMWLDINEINIDKSKILTTILEWKRL